MITDERITELWNLASNTATSKPDWTYSEIIFATVRAVIAEHDAELRKQEPVAWIHPLYKESGFKLVGITRWSDDCLPLYAAPIPPEQTGDALVEGMYQKMWKDFVSLQRGDAKQICVEAELYRKSLTAPIPPTPSQQEALDHLSNLLKYDSSESWVAVKAFILARPDAVQWQPIETCPKDGSSFLAWKAGRFNCVDHVVWYAGTVLQPSNEQRDAITHWMPLPARPDAPIPPDNHDWKAEYLRQVDLHNQTLDELREAEMQLRNPAPTPPTPSQQEALDALDNMNSGGGTLDELNAWGNVVESFILARPDEVTKNDRNKDGAIEFIDAVVLNKPIWPNPWGQDVAFVAFVIHSDRQRIAELEAELTEWEKLKDPINLHVNLLRGVPCRLDRMQHLLHLAGATDYDDLKAANAKMRKCLEAIAEHHDELSIYPTMPEGEPAQDQYHTERRDFAREATK